MNNFFKIKSIPYGFRDSTILEQPDTHFAQILYSLRGCRRAEEFDAARITALLQFGEPFSRHLISLEHVVLGFDHFIALGDVSVFQGTIRDEVLGTVVLELDPVGTRLGRAGDHLPGQVEIAIVVDTNLGRHEAWVAPADAPLADMDCSGSVHGLRITSLTRRAPPPSTSS